ncbi:GtrA-like protein [Vibrio aerogenes CECT 7868]|uniref:GtrA-like protein n=1 Tax=Vibrio aerogenes CECT 7868 TaxID=1216006 RepID=A0A1M6CIQ9_9VIBR|nr:GtrA family protein [Vibrio aerogenes]SHI60920.1 GtrA-like protein [Vibrio aerogenes CECT 7868]
MNQQNMLSQLNQLTEFISGRKVRFLIAGVMNTLFSYLVFILLYWLFPNYISASVISYLAGMMMSFFLNRNFVFQATAQRGQLPGFILVNMAALGCSVVALHLQVQLLYLPVYVAQVIATGVSMLINFGGYKMVFTRQMSFMHWWHTWKHDDKPVSGPFIIQLLVMCAVFVVTVLNIRESMLENVAHDALPYMEHYVGKFTSEGRWINFLLFDGLRQVPQVIAVSLCSAFVGIFGYQIAAGMKQPPWLAFCFCLAMVNIPYFTMLFKWPMTLLPGTFLLAVFACLKDKYSRSVLFIVSGILFFASYPAFYFLMPLLFIHQLSQESYRSLTKFLIVWILGYVLGYLVAQGSVYLYTLIAHGDPRWIEFARWRKSTPTTDLNSLLANMIKSAGNFERNALYLARLSPLFFIPVAFVFCRALIKQTRYTLIVLLVIFSLYASVIALGVKVPLRSGVTLPAGMLMMTLLVSHQWERLCLILLLFIPFSWQMHIYNTGYNDKRILVAGMLEAGDPQGYLKQSDRFHQVVLSLDETASSQYFYDLTQSKAFKNISYLRSHYIQPYLYQYGWQKADIVVNKVKHTVIRGEADIRIKDQTIYLSIR